MKKLKEWFGVICIVAMIIVATSFITALIVDDDSANATDEKSTESILTEKEQELAEKEATLAEKERLQTIQSAFYDKYGTSRKVLSPMIDPDDILIIYSEGQALKEQGSEEKVDVIFKTLYVGGEMIDFDVVAMPEETIGE